MHAFVPLTSKTSSDRVPPPRQRSSPRLPASLAVCSLLAAAIPALFVPSVFAQRTPATYGDVIQPGSIEGVLTAPAGSGKTTDGILVTITETGATATTDANGRFEFASVPPGTYTLVASGAGFGPLRITDVGVQPQGRRSLDAFEMPVVLSDGETRQLRELTVSAAKSSGGAAVGVSASSAKPDEEVIKLSEFTVTAEKREKSAQRTPMSISVLGSDMLKTNVVQDATGLTDYVPNLQIGRNGTAIEIAIRGIASSNNTEVGNPAGGFTVDGQGFGRPHAAGAAFFDVERIEVLRGPQGTLYGRNTIAGSINVITNKPQPEFATAADVSYGNYNYLRLEGMVNAPITEKLLLRAAFQSEQHDGYIDAKDWEAGVHSDADRADSKAARVHLLAKPSDDFSALFSASIFVDQGSQNGLVLRPLDGSEPQRRWVTGLPNAKDNLFWTVGVELNKDFEHFRITYLGGYRASRRDENTNGIVGTPPSIAVTRGNFYNKEDEQSHELRFTSTTGERLEWVAGLYYYLENNDVSFLIPTIGLGFIQPDVKEESKAAFGQATYKVTDRFRVTLGLRETRDQKSRTGAQWAVSTTTGRPTTLLSTNVADKTWSSFNWKAGVEFDLTSKSLLYATISTGYKAGGYFDGTGDIYYDPEELTAYEIGVKNRFLHNRLQVNLAAFYYDYKNFQVSDAQVNPNTGQLGTITRNISAMPVIGAELETSYLISKDDRIDFNLAHLDSEFENFTYSQIVSGVRHLRDLSGNELPKAPNWSAQLSYSHTWGLTNGGSLTLRLNSRWADGYYVSFDNHPIAPFPSHTRQGAFTKSDAILTYHEPQRRWFFEAFVKNIEDETILSTNGGNSTGLLATLEPPRTWGVRVGVKF